MKEYIASEWKSILQFNALGSFDEIWDLEAGWFEEPNERRGGWSGVSKIKLKTKESGTVGVFLKRQENHNTKSWEHPIRGIPTVYKEFKNILRLLKKDVPTVEPIYFSYRFVNGSCHAILMSKELEGFESLDTAVYARDGELMQDSVQREQVMFAVAKAMRNMHEHHFRHNCLYSKHVFVRSVEDEWGVKFIDLERSCWNLFKQNASLRDLYTFARRITGWGRKDRLRFFQMYMQEKKLSPKSKLFWRKIDRKIKRRGTALQS